MSTQIYIRLQRWKVIFFLCFSLYPHSSHPSTRKYPKMKSQRVYKVWQRRSGVTLETTLTQHKVARPSPRVSGSLGYRKTKHQQMPFSILTACPLCTKFPDWLQKLHMGQHFTWATMLSLCLNEPKMEHLHYKHIFDQYNNKCTNNTNYVYKLYLTAWNHVILCLNLWLAPHLSFFFSFFFVHFWSEKPSSVLKHCNDLDN